MNEEIINKISEELNCTFVFDVDTNSFYAPLADDMGTWIEVDDSDVVENVLGICAHYEVECDESMVSEILMKMKSRSVVAA